METLDARPVLAGPRRAEPPDRGCPGTASPNCIPQTGGAALRSRRRPPQWQVAGGGASSPRAAVAGPAHLHIAPSFGHNPNICICLPRSDWDFAMCSLGYLALSLPAAHPRRPPAAALGIAFPPRTDAMASPSRSAPGR